MAEDKLITVRAVRRGSYAPLVKGPKGEIISFLKLYDPMTMSPAECTFQCKESEFSDADRPYGSDPAKFKYRTPGWMRRVESEPTLIVDKADVAKTHQTAEVI